MARRPDPRLELIRALRRKAGITPIPLTEAERRSGAIEAITMAMTSPVEPRARPDSRREETFHDQPNKKLLPKKAQPKERIPRKATPEKFVQDNVVPKGVAQEKPAQKRLDQESELKASQVSTISKRTARYLAAYNKNR